MARAAKMTGQRLREIRERLGLTRAELAFAVGYAGKPTSLEIQIGRYETGARPVPPWIGRLAVMYDAYGVPERYKRRK